MINVYWEKAYKKIDYDFIHQLVEFRATPWHAEALVLKQKQLVSYCAVRANLKKMVPPKKGLKVEIQKDWRNL